MSDKTKTIITNNHRKPSCCDEGGGNAKEHNTETEDINNKAQNIITNGQEITQRYDIPPQNTLELLGYNFWYNHDSTQNYAEAKDLMEEEENLMVKYIKISEELMNYTNLIKIFNSRNDDRSKYVEF